MSPSENGRVGLLYMAYTVLANLTCTGLGMLLTLLVRPGGECTCTCDG